MKRTTQTGEEMTEQQYLQKEYAYCFFDPNTGGYDYQNEYYDL